MNVGIPTAYLITTKNLEAFLNALKTAKAPERVNAKFLTALDFTSSNDRLLIGVLKTLGFIDDSGVPTKRYFDFLDQSRSAAVLAEGIREEHLRRRGSSAVANWLLWPWRSPGDLER
ncbi:MAG: DUF5343 domain-containing protein [Bryobacteraceae bacterium]